MTVSVPLRGFLFLTSLNIMLYLTGIDLVSVPLRGFLFLTLSPKMLGIAAPKGLFAAGRIFSEQRQQPLPEKNSPKATIYEERRGFANP